MRNWAGWHHVVSRTYLLVASVVRLARLFPVVDQFAQHRRRLVLQPKFARLAGISYVLMGLSPVVTVLLNNISSGPHIVHKFAEMLKGIRFKSQRI